jgi:hypothetical protein
MLRTPFGWFTVLVGVFVMLSAAGVASARQGGTVFYLTLHPRQCVASRGTATGKTVAVVPCTDPSHKLEIYAVGHGGWGHKTPPPSALSIARSVCLSALERLTGHTLARGFGWWAFWPDPGSETARFGDKIICGLQRYPQLSALGGGWHVH